jgi:hypothetical protein
MIYRGPCFLAVVHMIWFLPHPLSLASCLSFSVILPVCSGRALRGGGDGVGAKSYDDEKAWLSFNQSLLPGTCNSAAHYDDITKRC